ncbi:MAG: T9SS type A sorting domain-containing protein, partial [Flavobacteriales bacterium]|nr:T9SS type A sorting domain-containing protein [Flavobacteriales bacterium]
VFTASSVDTTLNSLSTDTLELPLAWTPPATAADWDIPYTVTLDILSDSSDFTPANNGIVFPPFEISQFVMALDDHSSTPGNGGSNPGPGGVTEYEAGNQFDAIINDDLYALELVTGANTPVGTFIDVVLYQIDFTATPATYTQVWRSASYGIVAGDIGVVHSFYHAAGPNTPIASLIAGETYFAAVHSFVDYEYGISGLNPPAGTPAAAHSAIRYPNMATPNANSSFGLTNTPMIRLNFDGTVNVEVTNEEVAFNVYPNPSNGLFNINLSSDEANTVQLSVKNLVGQTIINKTVSVSGKTNHSISLANYSKGVYFLTVGNETVKLIVE